jgi:hypothetical protein
MYIILGKLKIDVLETIVPMSKMTMIFVSNLDAFLEIISGFSHPFFSDRVLTHFSLRGRRRITS